MGVVNQIITDLAVIDVSDGGLVLGEHAPGVSPEDIEKATGAPLKRSPQLKEMALSHSRPPSRRRGPR